MALFAVRVEVVHDKVDALVRLERAVACETARLAARGQKRVSTLGAKEVLLMVRALTKLLIFERHVVLVCYRSLAVMATRGKVLQAKKMFNRR
jgi:hypothetical protein